MKPLSDIVFGFSDAENYRRRENKEIFNKIFLRNEHVENLCKRNIFFLLGEKGTGKTAYAVYLSNTKYRNNNAIHKFIRETDYQKFISLKRTNNLSLSDYAGIWKVICYLLLADAIYKQAGTAEFLLKYRKFKALRDAIDEYYENAFSPEIPTALQFVENSEVAANIITKHLPIESSVRANESSKTTTNKKRFQTNLLILEKKFEECLTSLNLSENFIIFIDGIDIRPSSVPYAEYLDCVKGLANAIWSLNNDFFPAIRDTKGRMRAVLLVRPDIFNSLGLQNRNTKLKDNSLILDWRTTYPAHRESDIFKLADQMFSAQQNTLLNVGEAWDHYFPFNAASLHLESDCFTSFIVLLRYSFYRPRDILTILDFLNLLVVRKKSDPQLVFTANDLFSSEFKRAYGDYLLGEIKESLSFYYSDDEFETFLKFFEFLDGARKFEYERYLSAFEGFSRYLSSRGEDRPPFMRSAEEFLQFLYDLNIICFFERAEDETFLRWCFQERSLTNISPKVKTEAEYEIHYGLASVLNTGKKLRPRRSTLRGTIGTDRNQTEETIQLGSIKAFDPSKGYGFIVQPGLPVDIFFSTRDLEIDESEVKPGISVGYELTKDGSGRLAAKSIRHMKKGS